MCLCMFVCCIHRIPQAGRDLRRPALQRRVNYKTSHKTKLLKASSRQVLKTWAACRHIIKLHGCGF